VGERINGASLQENAMSAEVISMEDFRKSENEEYHENFHWAVKTAEKCMADAAGEGSGFRILYLLEALTNHFVCIMDMEGNELKELIEHIVDAVELGISAATAEVICPECAAEQETE
jgi:hypothetical protein